MPEAYRFRTDITPRGFCMSVNVGNRNSQGLKKVKECIPNNKKEMKEYYTNGVEEEKNIRGKERSYSEFICQTVFATTNCRRSNFPAPRAFGHRQKSYCLALLCYRIVGLG